MVTTEWHTASLVVREGKGEGYGGRRGGASMKQPRSKSGEIASKCQMVQPRL